MGLSSQSPVFAGGFTALVHRQRARLVAVARREGLSAEDAFDCAQDAFVVLLSAPEGPALAQRPEEAASFLVGTARNLARNRRRAHALARPHGSDEVLAGLADDGEAADALLAQAMARGELLGCMVRLEQMQRAVVTLRMLDEQPGECVGAALGLSPGHVAVLLHRAKASLRRCLEERRLDAYP